MKRLTFAMALIFGFLTFACGGGGGGSSTAYPESLALASPFINTTLASSSVKTAEYSASSSYATKKETLNTIINGDSITSCQIYLPSIPVPGNSPRAACYGPTLDYQYHLDTVGAATGSLPPGDLGIWLSSNGTEACTAAQINELTNDASAKVDVGLLFAASMVCIMKVNGTDLPAVGGSATLTSDLNTAVQVHNPAVTVTDAKIERLSDTSSGRPVYKYTIVSSISGATGTFNVTTYLKHSPSTDDNENYIGKLWSVMSTSTNTTSTSISYEKSDSTLKMKFTSAFNDAVSGVNMFDTNGNIDIASNWNHNFNYAIFNINTETGLGNISYSWQAGAGDSHARVFNAFTRVNGSSTEGCGFFSYGPRGDSTTATYPTNTISTFICNWAAPGNTHTGAANKAQKQCMQKNASGYFVSTTDNITYSPVNACSNTANQSNGTGNFGIKLSTEGSYSTAAITNNLVNVTTDTDYANYSAPTVPTEL